MSDAQMAQNARPEEALGERPGKESFESLVGRRLDVLLPAMEDSMLEGLYQSVLDSVERPLLSRVLARTAGNQSRAAEMLGISRNTLRKKMQTLGLAASNELRRID